MQSGELLESYGNMLNPTPISIQATGVRAPAPRPVEGSETRGAAEAVIPPRVPDTQTGEAVGEDIVRHPVKAGSESKQLAEQKQHLPSGTHQVLANHRQVACVDRKVGRPGRVSGQCQRGELLGSYGIRPTPISSQATHGRDSSSRGVEGSETSSRGKPVTLPRVPRSLLSVQPRGHDIVRLPGETLGLQVNSEGPVNQVNVTTLSKNSTESRATAPVTLPGFRREHSRLRTTAPTRATTASSIGDLAKQFASEHRVNCWKATGTVPVPTLISSQAADVTEPSSARAAEGSETSSRAKAVTEPRVPCPPWGEDIVRYSGENRRPGVNSLDNIMQVHGNHAACYAPDDTRQFGGVVAKSTAEDRVNCWKATGALASMLISSQSSGVRAGAPRLEAGSETRGTAEAMTPPRVPCIQTGEAVDDDIVRHSGETRRVSLNSSRNSCRPAHGDVVAQETVSGTMYLLRQAERALFTGNSDFISEQVDGMLYSAIKAYDSSLGADGQYDGWDDSTNVIDMAGKHLTEDSITEAAERVYGQPNYGIPTTLWGATQAMVDISRDMYPKERFSVPGPVNGKVGIGVNGVTTPFGDIELKGNVFIQPGEAPSATAVGPAASRPGTPTEDVAPAAAAHATSRFTAADAGDYIYKAVAVNRFGKSAPLTLTTVTVASGERVSFSLGKGAVAGTAYEIYRTAADGAAGTAKYIMTVAYTGDPQVVIDINRFKPGTSIAYLTQQDKDVMAVKQLAPLLKIPLATIDSSVRWMQLLANQSTTVLPGSWAGESVES